jgi:hypothetical protein
MLHERHCRWENNQVESFFCRFIQPRLIFVWSIAWKTEHIFWCPHSSWLITFFFVLPHATNYLLLVIWIRNNCNLQKLRSLLKRERRMRKESRDYLLLVPYGHVQCRIFNILKG